MSTRYWCHIPSYPRLLIVCLGGLFSATVAQAQDADWLLNSVSSDWNNAANWSPNTVPTGTAFFPDGSIVGITFSSPVTTVGSLAFPDAPPVSFVLNPSTGSSVEFVIDGVGISSSPVPPNFTQANGGELVFANASSAANANIFNTCLASSSCSAGFQQVPAGSTVFSGSSTAANATISNMLGGATIFEQNANAGSAGIRNDTGGFVLFENNASAAGATIANANFNPAPAVPTYATFSSSTGVVFGIPSTNAAAVFSNASTAANATITNQGNSGAYFFGTSSAGNATITNSGAANDSVNYGCYCGTPVTTYLTTGTNFADHSTAGSASIANTGSVINFYESSNAGKAVIISGNGGATNFFDNSSAGSATIATSGDGFTNFLGNSSASSATIMNFWNTNFFDNSSGGSATIINEGNGTTNFSGNSSAGTATIITGATGVTSFSGNSNGGQAALTVNMGGIADFSQTLGPANNRQITVGSIAGGGVFFLGTNQLTVGGDNANTVVTGVISDCGDGGNQCLKVGGGGGSLIKVGTGTLVLDGFGTYTGGTTVAGGALEIGDVSNPAAGLFGNVTVEGAILSGYAAIGGNVTNAAGGVVVPGAGGTLTVLGNYNQGPTGALRIELGPNAASQLNVSGKASLGGALDLIYDPGVVVGKEYLVLGAGSVSGRFAANDGTPPQGYFPVLTYLPNQVDVALEPAVTGAADSIWSSLTSAMIENAQNANAALMAHLASLGAGIGDGIYAGLAPAAPLRLAMNGNAPGLTEALAGLPDAMAHSGGWFRATGSFASLGGDSAAPGFDAQSGGFLAGFDRPIGNDYLAGIAAGYAHTNLTQSTGTGGTLDTPRVMAYGAALLGRVTVNGAVGYAYDSVSATRPNAGPSAGASANFSGQEATASVQASMHLNFHGVTVTPAGGFNYVHLDQAGFAETGAGGFDATVAGKSVDSLRPFISVTVTKSFVTDSGLTLTPEADLTWTHEAMSTARGSVLSLGGGTFSVAGVPVPRDDLVLGGGISARMTDRLALYADYHAVLPTANLFEQAVSAGLRYKF